LAAAGFSAGFFDAPLSSIAATKHRVVLLGEEIEQLGASRERRLPTGAQVFNLPHKTAIYVTISPYGASTENAPSC